MTKTDGYVQIPIGGRKVEFEDDAQGQVQDVTLEEAVPDVQPDDTPQVAVSQPDPGKEEKRKQRAKDRIKQLVNERKAETEAKIKAEQRAAELERQLLEARKGDKTTIKTQLESNIKMIMGQMTEAMKAGESELVVALNDELVNAKLALANVNKELAQTTQEEAPKPQETESPRNEIPERALQWIQDNPDFNTDPIFHMAAKIINSQLLKEGYLPDEDDLYEELDQRLAKKFGGKQANSVQLSQTKDDSSQVPDVKQAAKPVQQTMSGSSRPAAVASKSAKKITTVELSEADIAQAERWGLSLDQMARRMAHMAENKRHDGYAEIQITKK